MSRVSTSPEANSSSSSGVIVVGLDRAQLVDEVLAQHPPHPNGYSAPLLLIDPDASKAKALLAQRPELAQSRVSVFTGHRCAQDLVAHLKNRLDCPLARSVVASGAHVGPLARQVCAGIDALVKEQAHETARVRTDLNRLWASRGIEHWRARYAQIGSELDSETIMNNPARVLLVATRYSTFLRYSCEDLAQSLGEQGHEAHVLLQRDSHAALTPLRVLRAIEEFDPDLIVVNNHPRSLHPDKFPEGWPHVCWVQDAMPHLFAPLPAPVTELDFLAGHVFPNSEALRAFPDEAQLEFPVPISGAKFHAGPISPDSRDRLACDIGYVSHQSQPADIFCAWFSERLCEQFPDAPRDVTDRGHAMVQEIVDAWAHRIGDQQLGEVKSEMASLLGRPGDERLEQMLRVQFVHPLAEKLLRHQTLGWAAQTAERHGLTLKIFGNGWDAHPTLSRYAQGPLTHGDDLRACYQAAGVQLHASLHGCGHQRVFECAMSGGLAISRRSWGEFYRDDGYRISLFLDQNIPHDASLVQWKLPAYTLRNNPELRDIIEDRGRMPRPEAGWDHEYFQDVYARVPSYTYCDLPVPPPQTRPLSLLGDPFEMTFATANELETIILRAVGDADWRQQRSDEIAGRARETLSMDSFARRMMGMVGARLAHEHEPAAQEAAV